MISRRILDLSPTSTSLRLLNDTHIRSRTIQLNTGIASSVRIAWRLGPLHFDNTALFARKSNRSRESSHGAIAARLRLELTDDRRKEPVIYLECCR